MQSRHRFENNKTNLFSFFSVVTDGLLGVLSMDQHDLMLMSTHSHEKEQRKTDVFQRGSQKTDIDLLQWIDVYVIFLKGICRFSNDSNLFLYLFLRVSVSFCMCLQNMFSQSFPQC